MNYPIFPADTPFDQTQVWLDIPAIQEYLRIGSGEESFIYRLLFAAMAEAEGFCNQPLFRRVFTLNLSGFYSGTLPGYTATDVVLKYLPVGEAEPVIVENSRVVLSGNRLTLSDTLLSITSPRLITLSVTMGYSAENLPENIRLALLQFIGYQYDHRSNEVHKLPTVAQNLLNPFVRVTC